MPGPPLYTAVRPPTSSQERALPGTAAVGPLARALAGSSPPLRAPDDAIGPPCSPLPDPLPLVGRPTSRPGTAAGCWGSTRVTAITFVPRGRAGSGAAAGYHPVG